MSIRIPETRDGVMQALKKSLQIAVELEFATIPPYLYIIGSLVTEDGNGLKSKILDPLVVVTREEMVHMGLVCNILFAIGGQPVVNKDVPNYYPRAPLPGHDQTKDPFNVGLDQLSKEAIVTFLQIELPEPQDSLPESWDNWETIGQFYKGIEACGSGWACKTI